MGRTMSEVGPGGFDVMVDIDEVIFPWAEKIHEKCGLLGLHDGTKPWTSWQMWEDYGCTKDRWLDAIIAATSDGLYVATDPIPGAVEAINLLLWEGHRIHLVTARGFMANGREIRDWTRQWLDAYGVGRTTLTFAQDKVEAMDALEVRFDLAIDDSQKNWEHLTAAGINAWLLTAPHNVTIQTEKRVASLWEFAKIVQAQYAERTRQEVVA